jgi:hypothetical protein
MAKSKQKKEQRYLTETQRVQQRNKVQIGLRLNPALVDRLRNYAWATQIAGGVNGIIEAATLKAIERLEREYLQENGQDVPERPGAG